MAISIDLETLGTSVNSPILSIGACTFRDGEILDTFEINVRLNKKELVDIDTIKFWLNQPDEAVQKAFYAKEKFPMRSALERLRIWVKSNKDHADEVWANGTKFDLGMLEYQFEKHDLRVPWKYNADRCMRTLRMLSPVDMSDVPTVKHTALGDAIWQAKFIMRSLDQL
jgi:DNA polymerase III epsilon subunit-like protein